jgi:hypothetical protein
MAVAMLLQKLSGMIADASEIDGAGSVAVAGLLSESVNEDYGLLLLLAAFFNSLVLDYAIRLKISRNMNMFYIYQLHVPRLTRANAEFAHIVERAARLVCTTPEFDELARSRLEGLHRWRNRRAGAGTPARRTPTASSRSSIDSTKTSSPTSARPSRSSPVRSKTQPSNSSAASSIYRLRILRIDNSPLYPSGAILRLRRSLL